MGGGPLAEFCACMRCGKRAKRIFEGVETDTYECESCGHKSLVSWDEPADKSPWPISDEEQEARRKIWNKMHPDDQVDK